MTTSDLLAFPDQRSSRGGARAVGRPAGAEPVLAVVPCPRPRVGAEGLRASPGVRQGVAAQFLPPVRGVAGAGPGIPLIPRRRDGDPVPRRGLTRGPGRGRSRPGPEREPAGTGPGPL